MRWLTTDSNQSCFFGALRPQGTRDVYPCAGLLSEGCISRQYKHPKKDSLIFVFSRLVIADGRGICSGRLGAPSAVCGAPKQFGSTRQMEVLSRGNETVEGMIK